MGRRRRPCVKTDNNKRQAFGLLWSRMLAFCCRISRFWSGWVDGWMSDIPLISDILLSLHSLVVRYLAGIGQPTPQALARCPITQNYRTSFYPFAASVSDIPLESDNRKQKNIPNARTRALGMFFMFIEQFL